jgi:hypothetical protein
MYFAEHLIGCGQLDREFISSSAIAVNFVTRQVWLGYWSIVVITAVG